MEHGYSLKERVSAHWIILYLKHTYSININRYLFILFLSGTDNVIHVDYVYSPVRNCVLSLDLVQLKHFFPSLLNLFSVIAILSRVGSLQCICLCNLLFCTWPR